ncbi:DoxX family protein [Nocardia amamiensis]|uniref:DoxX family protein n=1 Tax=Nocardia TaxID=1817 RepID=UPI0033D4CFAD
MSRKLFTRSKVRTIAYWGATAVLVAETLYGAYWDLSRVDYVRQVFDRLEYPMYFATILGAAKLAAVAAVLTPGAPRLKEWAYAGLTYIYGGATLSHLFAGDGVSGSMMPVPFLAAGLLSWAFGSQSQRESKLWTNTPAFTGISARA